MNEEISEEFAKETGQEYLAWDNYRRFLQSWAMAKGVDREVFQVLMNKTKGRCEIGGHTIRCGDPISIDGRKGLFLKGMHPLKREVHILPI